MNAETGLGAGLKGRLRTGLWMTGLDRWQKYRTILMSGNAVGPALLVRRAIRGAGLGRDRSVVPLHGRRMYPDGDVGRMGFYIRRRSYKCINTSWAPNTGSELFARRFFSLFPLGN